MDSMAITAPARQVGAPPVQGRIGGQETAGRGPKPTGERAKRATSAWGIGWSEAETECAQSAQKENGAIAPREAVRPGPLDVTGLTDTKPERELTNTRVRCNRSGPV